MSSAEVKALQEQVRAFDEFKNVSGLVAMLPLDMVLTVS